MSNTFIFFSLIGALVFFGLHQLKKEALRKQASFKLYAVRDDLICLVAEGKLSENSRIFTYYYKRVNLLLEKAPDIGVDDAMNRFLYLKNDKGFEHAIREASKRADEMLALVDKESAEVTEVISSYYEASKNMILTHSSLVKLCYIVFLKANYMSFMENLLPEDTQQAIVTVKFAQEEASEFRAKMLQQAAC